MIKIYLADESVIEVQTYALPQADGGLIPHEQGDWVELTTLEECIRTAFDRGSTKGWQDRINDEGNCS